MSHEIVVVCNRLRRAGPRLPYTWSYVGLGIAEPAYMPCGIGLMAPRSRTVLDELVVDDKGEERRVWVEETERFVVDIALVCEDGRPGADRVTENPAGLSELSKSGSGLGLSRMTIGFPGDFVISRREKLDEYEVRDLRGKVGKSRRCWRYRLRN